jgi:glycosyltransferase involved in cell wall biosynthesis
LYLEHDPPLKIPTDTRHVVDDPNVTIVHVTHYNRLMWDNGDSPTEVVDHGILSQEVSYKGDIPKGIVVINNLDERGRRLGLDVFEQVRKHVPLDLIGMGSEKLNGLGEILHPRIPEFISHYRFFFNPIRYTSLGLAVLEAMTVGLPVVGLATTEMVTVIKNGKSGILHTNVDYLIEKMKLLIEDHSLAARIGAEGKAYVENRFNIQRFCSDWQRVLTAAMHRVSGNRSKQRAEKEREVPV